MPRIFSFWRIATVLVAFAIISLLTAPLGVIAHHDNEAEHAVKANDAGVSTTQVPADLPPTTSAKASAATTTMSNPPSDLQIEVLSLPSNAASLPKAKKNDPIEVHYVGTLFNGGAKFDSSRDRNKRFPFTLGAEQVIKGWDEGIVGMVPGELRRLIIPPHKAYGDRGFPGLIPANSTLVFEVELLSIGGRHRDL